MKEIYVLGVGNNTLVYIDLAEACGYKVAGLYHYDSTRTGEDFWGYKILGSFSDLYSETSLKGLNFALSQGNNVVRAEAFNNITQRGGCVATLIHPSANVSKFATIGVGVVVHMNSIIHPDVVVGSNTVFSYNSAITHSSKIGNNCYLAALTMIGAYTEVQDYVFLGIGVKTISGKVDKIGEYSYIGAGSLLTKSVEPYSLMMGSPARLIKKLDK